MIKCETALGATFAPEMVHRAASLLAKETKDRGAVALLAPTINIQRSPLGGRAFESFSEDPLLSGLMAASYVEGLQQNVSEPSLKYVDNLGSVGGVEALCLQRPGARTLGRQRRGIGTSP
jgi:beta-glucosidase